MVPVALLNSSSPSVEEHDTTMDYDYNIYGTVVAAMQPISDLLHAAIWHSPFLRVSWVSSWVSWGPWHPWIPYYRVGLCLGKQQVYTYELVRRTYILYAHTFFLIQT